jgi:metal-responsive CopG/Arc/MetJ family transcriptional regulator
MKEREMQLTIRIPDDYMMKIDSIAKKMGVKRSVVTRMAIKQYLDQINSEDSPDLFKKAHNLIGIVESGIPDLGQNHRKHIINKIKSQGE